MKKIIIIGSGKSGSSALVDYLAGRPDIIDPLNKVEFRLIQDPGGIAALHYAVGTGFQVNLSSAALKDFRELCRRMARPKNALPPGLGYSQLIDHYFEKVEKYRADIIELNYRGTPIYEASREPFFRAYKTNFLRKIYKRRNKKYLTGKIYLPVQETRFLDKTRGFLDSILETGVCGEPRKGKAVLVNQGGSFWSPISSTQYYEERQVIIVTRDPRDIFSEMKTIGYAYPGENVQLFCNWYANIIRRVSKKEWGHPLVKQLQFEQFINNFQEEKHNLDLWLGLDQGVESSYDSAKSNNNIGKYQNCLTEKELKIIEENLGVYLYPKI